MFGDFGHAMILLLFASYLCISEKKIIAKRINNEVFNIFFGGRYIILLMGLFSLYTGAMYNDIFSKSANIFGSSWSVSKDNFLLEDKPIECPAEPCIWKNTVEQWLKDEDQLNPTTNYSGTPYPFGMDPIWLVSFFFTNNKK